MTRRVGLIVPSSNVTVETELPQLLRRQPGLEPSFHSSRMRMTAVNPAALAAMNVQRERCVLEIADAGPDVILYACLVALMAGEVGEQPRVVEGLVDAGGDEVVLAAERPEERALGHAGRLGDLAGADGAPPLPQQRQCGGFDRSRRVPGQ